MHLANAFLGSSVIGDPGHGNGPMPVVNSSTR